MNSQGKAATFVVVILAAACAVFALMVVAKFEDAKAKISGLEVKVLGLQKDVASLKVDKAALEGALDNEKKVRETAEAELDRTKEMNVQLTKELEGERDKLARAMDEVAKTKGDLENANSERKDVQERLDKAVSDMTNLKRELEKVQQLTGGKQPGAATEGQVIEGTVRGVFMPNFVTIALSEEATKGLQPVLFVHRGNEVVGKVTMAKVHTTSIAAEVSDPSVLSNIRVNDRVRLRSEQPVQIFSAIEGKVGKKEAGGGIVTIDVGPECVAGFKPVFDVSRGGEQVGEIQVSRISYAAIVAELVDGESLSKIQEKDELKAPR